jgi:hypothetical protein
VGAGPDVVVVAVVVVDVVVVDGVAVCARRIDGAARPAATNATSIERRISLAEGSVVMGCLMFMGCLDNNFTVMISGAQIPASGLSAAEKGLNSYEPGIRGMRTGNADGRYF